MLAQGAGGAHGDREGRIVDLTGRLPVTTLGLLASLCTGIAGNALGAPASTGVAWAVLAGFGLSMMVHGRALQVLGGLTGALAVLGGVVASGERPWLIAGFAAALVAAAGIIWRGPTWRRRSREGQQRVDMWRSLDEGQDPTL